MPRIIAGGQYYTAKEVKEKLGITQGELNTFIRNGTLRPETPPGKKQGVYRRAAVDQLVRERQAFMAISQKTSSMFSKATKEDIKATVEVTSNNSDICYYTVEIEGELVGYALMVPLKLEIMEKLLRHEQFTVEIEDYEE